MTEDRITQRTITAVMIVIAALAFVFSFGNVWSLALRLASPLPSHRSLLRWWICP